jgi:hypothetical protein
VPVCLSYRRSSTTCAGLCVLCDRSAAAAGAAPARGNAGAFAAVMAETAHLCHCALRLPAPATGNERNGGRIGWRLPRGVESVTVVSCHWQQ